jgi:hypothetical protein
MLTHGLRTSYTRPSRQERHLNGACGIRTSDGNAGIMGQDRLGIPQRHGQAQHEVVMLAISPSPLGISTRRTDLDFKILQLGLQRADFWQARSKA